MNRIFCRVKEVIVNLLSSKCAVINFPVKHALENGTIRVRSRGVHPSEAMMHFPTVSQFSPYFRKNFQTPRNISPIGPFPTKFSDSHPPKISDDLFFLSFSH